MILQLILLSFLLPPGGNKLTISFTGVEGNKGKVYMSLYTNDRGWPDESDKALMRKVVPVKNGLCSASFSGIGNKDVAVAAFYDKNGNGELDTNFFGVPTEPYGFSKNKRGTMSAPDWDDCAFYLDANRSITIHLR